MFSKHKAHPEHNAIHAVKNFRQETGHRGALHYYWPIILFVLLSALTQTVGSLY